jgi:hypothetical protein
MKTLTNLIFFTSIFILLDPFYCKVSEDKTTIQNQIRPINDFPITFPILGVAVLIGLKFSTSKSKTEEIHKMKNESDDIKKKQDGIKTSISNSKKTEDLTSEENEKNIKDILERQKLVITKKKKDLFDLQNSMPQDENTDTDGEQDDGFFDNLNLESEDDKSEVKDGNGDPKKKKNQAPRKTRKAFENYDSFDPQYPYWEKDDVSLKGAKNIGEKLDFPSNNYRKRASSFQFKKDETSLT